MTRDGRSRGGGSGDDRDQSTWKQSERADHVAKHLEKQLEKAEKDLKDEH